MAVVGEVREKKRERERANEVDWFPLSQFN